MSHVATIDLHILDLAALSEAADRLGLELVRDQKTYRWYGRYVGDAPLPEGFKEEELGHCQHALRLKDPALRADAYEIGVASRKDGKPGYCLLWDYIDYRLLKILGGVTAPKIRQEYARAVAIKQLRQRGYAITEKTLPGGALQLQCSKV